MAKGMNLDKIIELAVIKDRDENNKYVAKLMKETKEEIIDRTNENCTNQVKLMITQINAKGCAGLEIHTKRHETRDKRFFKIITISPAIITALVLLFNWGKKIFLETIKS